MIEQRSTRLRVRKSRTNLCQAEGGRASVALLGGSTGGGGGEVGGGDGVAASGVGVGGDGLGDLEDEATGGLGDGPGAGRVLAGTVGDGGEVAIAGQHLAAGDTVGLHGVGLEDSEGVTAKKLLDICSFERLECPISWMRKLRVTYEHWLL